MKNHTSRKRIIRLSKHLKGFIKPFPRYGKAINAVVLLAFVMIVVGGAAALTVHNKKPQTVVLKQASSTNKPVSTPATTAPTTDNNTSTQPAQTTTPSTPTTTTTPKPSTPTTYPSVIDGVVWASSTCHYYPGYGEAYWRNDLVQSIQSSQTSVSNYWSDLLNQSIQNPSLYTDQQILNDINQYITVTNSGIMSFYGQYVTNVNSIGCTETIVEAQIPQIQACTDINGCSDNIFGISIPSLE